MSNGTVNPELLKLASDTLSRFGRQKRAFIPGGDPSMTGGADPSQGGGDPSQGGPPPGGDPSQGGPPPGGDPSGGGGAPPSDPRIDQLMQMMTQMQAQMQQGGGGGGAGGAGGPAGAGGLKPKIDVNVTLLQLLKMVSRIADHLHIHIPASEMVATQNDLTGFAQQQQSGQDPSVGGGAGAGGPPGGIQPMQGFPDMSAGPGAGGKQASDGGVAYKHDGLETLTNNADKVTRMLRLRHAS